MINDSQIDQINFNSNNSPLRSKIFDPFHGGRALGAIYGLDDINVYETAILLFLGSKNDFKDETQILARVSRKEICKATKLTMPTFCRSVKSLIDKNYLYVSNNYDDNGLQVENTYYLTDYLFIKYAASRGVNLREYHTDTPGVSHREIYNTSVAIAPDGASLEAEQIGIKEKEINNIDLKYCASEAEGEPLSLCQSCRNYEQIEDSGLASPISAHDNENDLDDIFPEPIKAKDQFATKIKKTTDEHPEYITPRVTPSHRKMVQIFRITDPQVKKKSFVKDNDIYFMTDQILEKHGKDGHAIIDQLYKDMIEEGLCGKLPWNLKSVWIMIDVAFTKMIEKNE